MRRIIFLYCLALPGCFSQLTRPGAALGIVTSSSEVKKCLRVGHVIGDSGHGMGTGDFLRNAMVEARNRAGILGGTHIIITTQHAEWPSAHVEFEVYNCREPSNEPAHGPRDNDAGGCGKDTDCKDDRICTDGACVSPGYQ